MTFQDLPSQSAVLIYVSSDAVEAQKSNYEDGKHVYRGWKL